MNRRDFLRNASGVVLGGAAFGASSLLPKTGGAVSEASSHVEQIAALVRGLLDAGYKPNEIALCSSNKPDNYAYYRAIFRHEIVGAPYICHLVSIAYAEYRKHYPEYRILTDRDLERLKAESVEYPELMKAFRGYCRSRMLMENPTPSTYKSEECRHPYRFWKRCNRVIDHSDIYEFTISQPIVLPVKVAITVEDPGRPFLPLQHKAMNTAFGNSTRIYLKKNAEKSVS